MHIGIIGTGHVGGPLAALWSANGHDIRVSASRPDSPSLLALLEQTENRITPTTIPELADASEIVVLAVPWSHIPQVLEQTGTLPGKIVIDVTNPFKPDYSGLEYGLTSSGAEVIASKIPQASVVKAFNTVAAATLTAPVIDGVAASVFLCSDDPTAQQTVARLVTEIGFDPVNTGPLQSARYLEPVVMLWRELVQHEHPQAAFRVLRPH